MALDIAIFSMPGAWVQLLILLFLEIALGIDNLVFIAITTDRLPDDKKVIGRRVGLLAALCMRIILLSFASWIISLKLTIFTLPFNTSIIDPEFSGKDIILLAGGAYLIYKGIEELSVMLSMKEETAGVSSEKARQKIGLLQAIATIAVMDIVFSLDSVITAVGLVNELLIMILAVMIAVLLMIIFANIISEFINNNPEIKLLALAFIVAVGVKLVIASLGIEVPLGSSGIDGIDIILYVALGFALILTVIQMLYNHRLSRLKDEVRAGESRKNEE